MSKLMLESEVSKILNSIFCVNSGIIVSLSQVHWSSLTAALPHSQSRLQFPAFPLLITSIICTWSAHSSPQYLITHTHCLVSFMRKVLLAYVPMCWGYFSDSPTFIQYVCISFISPSSPVCLRITCILTFSYEVCASSVHDLLHHMQTQ